MGISVIKIGGYAENKTNRCKNIRLRFEIIGWIVFSAMRNGEGLQKVQLFFQAIHQRAVINV